MSETAMLRRSVINKKFERSNFGEISRPYLPEDAIQRLVAKEEIETTLAANFNAAKADTLLEFIQNKARKVFLILECLLNPEAIELFYNDDFCDEHLPVMIQIDDAQPQKSIVKSLDESTGDCDSKCWEQVSSLNPLFLENFESTQWKLLAPVFQKGVLSKRFDPSRPLPLTTDNSRAPPRGQFGTVNRAYIHKAHIADGAFGDVVAIKSFQMLEKKFFEKELKILEQIKRLEHDYLITPLVGFNAGVHYCLLFPWCNGGM